MRLEEEESVTPAGKADGAPDLRHARSRSCSEAFCDREQREGGARRAITGVFFASGVQIGLLSLPNTRLPGRGPQDSPTGCRIREA